MFVILVYDVKAKRVGKVMKICKKYLSRIQNSVFEGEITDSNLCKLKLELSRVIDSNYDSVKLYKMKSTKYCYAESIGLTLCNDLII